MALAMRIIALLFAGNVLLSCGVNIDLERTELLLDLFGDHLSACTPGRVRGVGSFGFAQWGCRGVGH